MKRGKFEVRINYEDVPICKTKVENFKGVELTIKKLKEKFR